MIKQTHDLKRLWKQIPNSYRNILIKILFLTIVATGLEVISIGAALPFLSIIIAPEIVYENPKIKPLAISWGILDAKELIVPMAVLFLISIYIASFIRWYLLRLQTNFSYKLSGEFGEKIYNNILNQNYIDLISNNNLDKINVIISKTNYVVHYTLLPLLTILSSSFTIIIMMGALFLLNPLISIALFISISTTYILIVKYFKNITNEIGKKINIFTDKVFSVMTNSMGSLRDILISGTHEKHLNTYASYDRPRRLFEAKLRVIAGAPRYILEAVAISVIAVIAIISTKQEGAFAIALVGTIAVGAQRMLPVVQQIYSGLIAINGNKTLLSDVLSMLEKESTKLNENNFKDFSSVNEIELKNVSFKYEKSNIQTLRNLNIKIKKGDIIGIVGKTGSGKSTLIDILMGLLKPTEGKIYINNINLDIQNIRSWWNKLAYVPQQLNISDDTLLNNIISYRNISEIDHNSLNYACSLANLQLKINSLPMKLETKMGERGILFSGGELQRIAIARAIYKNPEVLILDEATSALDQITQKEIIGNLKLWSEYKIIIIITHRSEPLSICNKIFRLTNENFQEISFEDACNTIN